MKPIAELVCFLAVVLSMSESANILGLWVLPGRSHFILGNALLKGLAEAGHDVTLISPFEEEIVPPKNGTYRRIVIQGIQKRFDEIAKNIDLFKFNDIDSIVHPLILSKKIVEPFIEATFEDPNVKALLTSGEKFDAVIVEQFMNDPLKAFATHFDAHLIIFSPVFACSWMNDMVGNPSPLAYVPDILTSFPASMNFWQRTHNTALYFVRRILLYSYILPQEEIIRMRYLPNTSSVYDLNVNVSLILLNSHESYSQPVPLVPNMVQIGGYHIQPPKKLPKDLQTFLDESKEGVIYFSMGSHLRSSDLPEFKRNVILKALGKLKQKVLWKFENDNLSGKPKNVEIRQWVPQSDILAHKNVKLFITHGGILSSSEAIYHGVPLLSIPVYGDQITNARSAEANGYALRLNFNDDNWSEERFSSLLDELLNNSKYRENARRRSSLFHDRPMTPMETAVYWVEYVIRNNGAHHLRVLGTTLPWYQYYLVDVISFLAILVLGIVTSTVFVIRSLYRIVSCKNQTKQKKA